MTLLIVAIVVLQLLDGVSTWYALERSQGLSEGNPIVKWLMDRLGTIGALVAYKGVIAAVVLTVPLEVWGYWVILAYYVAVIGNNVYRILK